jgi:hypothetical protein
MIVSFISSFRASSWHKTTLKKGDVMSITAELSDFGLLDNDGNFESFDSMSQLKERIDEIAKKLRKNPPGEEALNYLVFAVEDAGYVLRTCGYWMVRYSNRIWLADASGLSLAVFGGFLGNKKHKERVTPAQMEVLKRTADPKWLSEWFITA